MRSEDWRQGQRDDLTLPEFVNMLWGWRALVLGCALALSLAAVVFELARGTTHIAEAAVSVQPAERLDAAEEPEVFAQKVRDAVSVFAPDLTQGAARKAGWTAGAREFGERLETEIDPNTGEIRVRFSAGTPEEASNGANAYAESLALRVEDLGKQRLAGGTLAAEAQVVREARPEMVRSRGPLLYGGLACAAGLLLGSAGAFFLESRTHRWRGARDAELTLGAPVLGTIPLYGSAEEKS